MASTKDTSKKKPYHAPRLRVYGTVDELTQTSGASGKVYDQRYVFDPKTG